MRLYKISADLDILNVRNTYSEISKDEFYKLTYNELLEIKEDGYCRVSDGYNKPSGWYARDAFYKINKIS